VERLASPTFNDFSLMVQTSELVVLQRQEGIQHPLTSSPAAHR
jgi:hypothetical protein